MKRKIKILRSVLIALFAMLLMLPIAGYLFRGPLILSAPARIDPRPVSPDRLRELVTTLAVDYRERWYTPPEQLNLAADWVLERFHETGLDVQEQTYSLMEGEYRNIIAVQQGSSEEAGIVIVGAHYDAYGKLPGADDNASGVAVLIELMNTLPETPPKRTRIFVAFANEEPPLFSSEDMGSWHFARKIQDDDVKVDLMIALDLVGYFSDEPDSQQFPAPWLKLFFPTTGNFISVVGDMTAGRSIKQVKRGMMSGTGLPVVSMRGPKAIPGITWSDHLWFREFGMPAVLISDTAMLRNPHYHRSTDLPETLDYERMAEVVQGLHGVLQDE